MAKIKCEWCNGFETPFHKLNYGYNKFICENCYLELEKDQERYDKWLKK